MLSKRMSTTSLPARGVTFVNRLHRVLLEPDRGSFFVLFCLILGGSCAAAILFHWPPAGLYIVGITVLSVWFALIRCRP